MFEVFIDIFLYCILTAVVIYTPIKKIKLE